jgi:hypothetical protein
VTRRHPAAVYRVIDEQELLGGEDFELTSRPELAGGDTPIRAVRRPRRRGWSGWGSTTLGVVALACVAGLLLNVSPRSHAPRPASSPRVGVATLARHPIRAAVPARVPSRTRPLPRPVRPKRRLLMRYGRRASARRPVDTVARARAVLAVRSGAGSVTPPPSAPDREFGFER